MRITILNQFYTPDLAPTAHLTESLAEYLADRGHEVRVIASRGGYVAASESSEGTQADKGNPRILRMWTPRLGKKRHLYRILDYAAFYGSAALKMLFCGKQDAVVSLTTPPLIGLTSVAHKLFHPSTRVILWNMDCYPDLAEATDVIKRGSMLSSFLAGLVRLQMRFTDHLVVLDGAMGKLLTDRYANKRRKALPVTIVPNWERRDFFPEPPLTAEPVTEERPLTVLYLGNAGYGHRFDTVISAATELANEPVRFMFVGGGRRWEEIQDAVEEAGLQNVEMQGYVPKEETPHIIAAADCALITLRDNTLGVMSPSKMHANLASGLPVVYVGPPGSNVDEAITQYDCGVTVRHGEVDQLVEGLRTLMNDSDRRLEFRKNARRAFEERYNDKVTLPLLESVILNQ